ncbi:MAG: GNAT family N-acetyltransferase [Planctomycetota bacterium]
MSAQPETPAARELAALGVSLRTEPRPDDLDTVRVMVAASGFFYRHEVEIAVELVRERLARGAEATGYYFVFAERAAAERSAESASRERATVPAARPIAYTCYGPIGCTLGSFDLYWIVVDNAERGRGLGRLLLRDTEARIAQAGGRRVYVETSGRAQYEPTRRFYEHCGYVREAVLREFYGPGDDKIVYVKPLTE